MRIGDWKGIRQNLMPQTGKKAKAGSKAAAKPNLAIELYNLKDDRNETKNVAAQHPDIVAKIEKLMRQQHVKSAEFPFPALDALRAWSAATRRRFGISIAGERIQDS